MGASLVNAICESLFSIRRCIASELPYRSVRQVYANGGAVFTFSIPQLFRNGGILFVYIFCENVHVLMYSKCVYVH